MGANVNFEPINNFFNKYKGVKTMGACSIERTVTCPKDFFNSSLIASWSNSDDCYSGDWNTCSSLRKVVKVFDKCTETNLKKWQTQSQYQKMYNDALDELPKRYCMAFDLGVVGYEVWSTKKTKLSSAKKPIYKTKFAIYKYDNNGSAKEIATKETQAEADKYVSKYILEKDTGAFWVKEKVLVSGKEESARFSVVKKTYKTKPKTLKVGTVLHEIHKYHVIGIAAE